MAHSDVRIRRSLTEHQLRFQESQRKKSYSYHNITAQPPLSARPAGCAGMPGTCDPHTPPTCAVLVLRVPGRS